MRTMESSGSHRASQEGAIDVLLEYEAFLRSANIDQEAHIASKLAVATTTLKCGFGLFGGWGRPWQA